MLSAVCISYYLRRVDLICVGVNSIILHELGYYNINKWHTNIKEWQTKEETEEISSLLADVNKEIIVKWIAEKEKH